MNPITAIVQRNLLNYVRSKGRILGSLFMSIFMLVMFSFLMKSAMNGLDAPMPYLISGVIIMSVFQVSVNNSSDILSDISSGYMKEVLVAPIARTQISMGHILSGGSHRHAPRRRYYDMRYCAWTAGGRSANPASDCGNVCFRYGIQRYRFVFGDRFPKLPRLSNPQLHDYDAPDLCFRRIYSHHHHTRFSPAYRLPESADLYDLDFPLYRFGGAYIDHRGIGKTGHGF